MDTQTTTIQSEADGPPGPLDMRHFEKWPPSYGDHVPHFIAAWLNGMVLGSLVSMVYVYMQAHVRTKVEEAVKVANDGTHFFRIFLNHFTVTDKTFLTRIKAHMGAMVRPGADVDTLVSAACLAFALVTVGGFGTVHTKVRDALLPFVGAIDGVNLWLGNFIWDTLRWVVAKAWFTFRYDRKRASIYINWADAKYRFWRARAPAWDGSAPDEAKQKETETALMVAEVGLVRAEDLPLMVEKKDTRDLRDLWKFANAKIPNFPLSREKSYPSVSAVDQNRALWTSDAGHWAIEHNIEVHEIQSLLGLGPVLCSVGGETRGMVKDRTRKPQRGLCWMVSVFNLFWRAPFLRTLLKPNLLTLIENAQKSGVDRGTVHEDSEEDSACPVLPADFVKFCEKHSIILYNDNGGWPLGLFWAMVTYSGHQVLTSRGYHVTTRVLWLQHSCSSGFIVPPNKHSNKHVIEYKMADRQFAVNRTELFNWLLTQSSDFGAYVGVFWCFSSGSVAGHGAMYTVCNGQIVVCDWGNCGSDESPPWSYFVSDGTGKWNHGLTFSKIGVLMLKQRILHSIPLPPPGGKAREEGASDVFSDVVAELRDLGEEDAALSVLSKNEFRLTENAPLLRLFLQKKLDDDNTLFLSAVARGHVSVARRLLQWGADVNQYSTVDRRTPLRIAREKQNVEMEEMLVDWGGEENLPGLGPVLCSVGKSPEMVEDRYGLCWMVSVFHLFLRAPFLHTLLGPNLITLIENARKSGVDRKTAGKVGDSACPVLPADFVKFCARYEITYNDGCWPMTLFWMMVTYSEHQVLTSGGYPITALRTLCWQTAEPYSWHCDDNPYSSGFIVPRNERHATTVAIQYKTVAYRQSVGDRIELFDWLRKQCLDFGAYTGLLTCWSSTSPTPHAAMYTVCNRQIVLCDWGACGSDESPQWSYVVSADGGTWSNDLTFSQVCVLMLKQQNGPLPLPPPHEGGWYDILFDLVVGTEEEAQLLNLLNKNEKHITGDPPLLTRFLHEKLEDGHTLFLSAVIKGHVEVARRLLQWGADVNHPSSVDGRTPLEIARGKQSAEMEALLVDWGAKGGPGWWSPIH